MTTLKTKHLQIEEIEKLPEDVKYEYFGTPSDTPFEMELTRDRASYFAKVDPAKYQNKIVYDIGCGFGDGARYLAEKYNCKVIAIDPNDKALAVCGQRNKHPNVTYLKKLASETGLPINSADVVNTTEVIEHLDDVERDLSLLEWNRILKLHGVLYVTTPERRLPKDRYPEGSHWTEYDFEELVKIIQSYGFNLIWNVGKNKTEGVSMALAFEKVKDVGIKTDQNTPITEINPITNPKTRSCIDRYVILSSWCKDKSVLSLACGYGYGELILKALGAKEVIGIDNDLDAIQHLNVNYGPLIKGIHGDFIKENIDLQRKFDVIVSVETFEHVTQRDALRLLDTIKTHTTPQTSIYITTPMRRTPVWEYKGGTHLYEYSATEFEEIMKLAFGETHNVKFMGLGEKEILKDYVTFVITDEDVTETLSGLIMVACITPK